MKTEIIILFLGIFFTGMMAGIFFTWTNSVTPGIGRLCDLEYLRALQSMNRTILNTAFRIVFIGAVITVALIPIFYFKMYPDNLFWLYIIAFSIYWVGAFGVTFLGNIPLNRMLDQTNLESITLEDAKALRNIIEVKWNNLNSIRTISSGITFLLLILSINLID